MSGRFYEPPLATKRFSEPADSSWSWQQQQEMNRPVALEGSKPNWNSNMWEWDSVMFAAKPTQNLVSAGGESSNGFKSQGPEILSLGYEGGGGRASNGSLSMEQKRKMEETTKPLFHSKDSSEDDDGDLALKLGGKQYSYADDGNSSRQNKRVRSGSPGSSYPMCQVDDCRSDLTGAKDYHRRHKVCQAHSKASRALVGNLMQRFCQQCSRLEISIIRFLFVSWGLGILCFGCWVFVLYSLLLGNWRYIFFCVFWAYMCLHSADFTPFKSLMRERGAVGGGSLDITGAGGKLNLKMP